MNLRKEARELKIDLSQRLKAYIAYLRAELTINAKYDLDLIQTRVLNEILFAESNNQKINVGKILKHREIASQATLHAALKKLQAKGLISYETENDSRVKYLMLTELCRKRYGELAKEIDKE